MTYGGKYMHCWIGQKGGSHGTLDLEGGLKNSCNAYFFQYGNAAGVDAIDKVASLVGIGQKTGIELSNEAAGILPGKEWFAVHATRANAGATATPPTSPSARATCRPVRSKWRSSPGCSPTAAPVITRA